MDVIINSEIDLIPPEAQIFLSEKDPLLNLLKLLGYDPINPPIAQVLSLYHQLKSPKPLEQNISKELRTGHPSSALRAPSPHAWGEGKKEEVLWEGNWFILSPLHWQVTHNDAMIVAAGRELGLDANTSQQAFHLYANYLASEGLSLYYHDAYTWLLRAENKPLPNAKPVYHLLNHSLMPELEQLDKSLYWQKFFTEGQMFFASHSDFLPVNGAWVWGGASLGSVASDKSKTICADETWFSVAKIDNH